MANEKITDMDAHGAFADTDLFEVVDDPAGTPDNEKAEVGDLLDYAAGRNVRETVFASVAAPSAAGLLTLISDGVHVARDTGAAQKHYGPIWPLTPLDQSGWSWVNQGGASVAQASGVVYLTAPSTGTSIRARVTTAPATPYTITALLRGRYVSGPNQQYGGLIFRESGTSKLYLFYVANGAALQAVKFTNETTFSAVGAVNTTLAGAAGNLHWLRISDDGTTLRFALSIDGVNFKEYGTEGRTVFMAGAPNQVGVFANVDSSVGEMSLSVFSWLVG